VAALLTRRRIWTRLAGHSLR